MLIIKTSANEIGSRPPMQAWNGDAPPAGYAEIPDSLDTSCFYTHNGFVHLTLDGDTVTAMEPNIEAWEAWKASLQPVEPPAPTAEDDMNAMLVDHEYRLTLMELGV